MILPPLPFFSRTPFGRLVTGLSLALLLHSSGQAQPVKPRETELDRRVNQMLDAAYEAELHKLPTELTRQGSKERSDEWDDLSLEAVQQRLAIWVDCRERIRQEVSNKPLAPETKLSLQLLDHYIERNQIGMKYFEYDYAVNQMFGLQAELPALLINSQRIDSLSDAQAYIRRLRALPKFVADLNAGLVRRQNKGVLPPRFVFDYVLDDIDKLLLGFPLTGDPGSPHPLMADFSKKVELLQLSDAEKTKLMAEFQSALKDGFGVAYRSLRQTVADQQTSADEQDGVWKFPEGDSYYAVMLGNVTTTERSPQEIHEIGQAEVERIHQEMEQLVKKVGFQGDLKAFFEAMRTDPKQHYPDNQAGRKECMADANRIIDQMRKELPRLFLTLPKAPLVVKAVEGYREKSAGKAFYDPASLDGTKPGIYYANLYDLSLMPRFSMEALAYHEAIPGHHMQISISQELTSVPKFRRSGNYTAYIEGWGLYCEQLPKEYGFYQNPYSDFGRLSMELFRAVRLVVDTGIHYKHWTRQQALDYYQANTPNSKSDCQKMVDRHIVMPAQATAYKVGMMEILRLRAKAKTKLGSKFDIRKFHDVLLTHGAVPLNILEQLVDQYIQENSSQ